ncbi:MAG: amidohydrolase family protein [Chloroflexota bacterium]
MIVDCHVGIDSERFPIERALAALRAANVGGAVIFADAGARDIEAQNRYVLRVAQSAEDLYPFYYLGGNPFTDTRPDALMIPDDIGDFAGIRWHFWAGEAIDRGGVFDQDELQWAIGLMESAEFESMMSAAAHYDMPIMFEEPFGVTVEFALRYPAVDIIIPHLGSRSGGEANVVRALWDQQHVYFGTSLAPIDESVLSRVGTHRILFGSGYPEGDPEIELEKVDRLPVPEDVKEDIFGNNLLSLLGQTVLD